MLAKQLQGAAKSAVPQYIEDVFSTWLYTGTQPTTQSINNGIDLSGKGGMVWIKSRSNAYAASIYDTNRGIKYGVVPSSTAAQPSITGGNVDLYAFNNNGFSVGSDNNFNVNTSAATFASWTFRKQAKFFDIVTYTGNGVAGRTVAHSLGATPGCIIIKRTDAIADWYVYHRSLSLNGSAPNYVWLNDTSSQVTGSSTIFPAAPTSTVFSVGNASAVNSNGATFVAYIFAHDAGGFGAAGTDNVISCGSYTGDGAATKNITINYEPQWVLVKNASAATNWLVIDQMRGMPTGTDNSALLNPNLSNAESSNNRVNTLSATGFLVQGAAAETNASGNTYIYIAIRRGPMRTPTSGTSVFSPNTYNTATAGTSVSTGFPIDTQISAIRTASATIASFYDRLRGVYTSPGADGSGAYLRSSTTTAETAGATHTRGWDNNGFQVASFWTSSSVISWNLRRAPGFFDVVCYTGTGANQLVNHNLGVAPELVIFRNRIDTAAQLPGWMVQVPNVLGTGNLQLNTAAANSTGFFAGLPTSTQLATRASGNYSVNFSGYTYVAYLFATVTGVSKVGSYQGNGTSKTIDCGFTAGARFVMIKRTDSTGDWYVWDTARGIVSGNDPHLSLNTTVAEVTTDDTIDPDNSGFIVNQVAATNVNVNNATYIFLAIA